VTFGWEVATKNIYMNNIIIEEPINDIAPGDIYALNEDMLYIIANIGGKYAAIALYNGRSWNGLKDEIEDCISSEHTLYARNAVIKVSK